MNKRKTKKFYKKKDGSIIVDLKNLNKKQLIGVMGVCIDVLNEEIAKQKESHRKTRRFFVILMIIFIVLEIIGWFI